MKRLIRSILFAHVPLTLLILCYSSELSASTTLAMSLESVICSADVVVVAQVLDVMESTRIENYQKEDLESCDFQYWQFPYRVKVSEALSGQVQLGEINLPFVYRASMSCSLVTPHSGIETKLSKKNRYILLLVASEKQGLNILRAEPVKSRARVIELRSKCKAN